MEFSRLVNLLFLLQVVFLNPTSTTVFNKKIPLVVITWDYLEATEKAWQTIYNEKRSSLDTIEESCSLCERLQCRTTVGFGGSPDENGETTLDAVIMDGVTMDVGGVGLLRNVKNVMSVARRVLENTDHSLLGGELAEKFAVQMGFKNESLETSKSLDVWKKWQKNNCQPNFWKNVEPDPSKSCGPYKPVKKQNYSEKKENLPVWNEENHDTIGVISIDTKGHIAAGTSTNGAKYKIAGRIGDSPIAGAGAYADQEIGAAAATGAGDIMMRFLPSFLAVEEMRRGATPEEAATTAVRRIAKHYPTFSGAVIALDKDGNYGAACNGVENGFPFYVANLELEKPTLINKPCIEATFDIKHELK